VCVLGFGVVVFFFFWFVLEGGVGGAGVCVERCVLFFLCLFF